MDVKTFGTSLETLLHRFENPRLGLALIWIMARCGEQKAISIRAQELAIVLGVSKQWACRMIEDLVDLKFIAKCKLGVNLGVNSTKYSLDRKLQKYDITICYDNIFKGRKGVHKLNTGVKSGVNWLETDSPCDVAEVVAIKKPKKQPAVEGVNRFIAAYIDAYRRQYGNTPHVKGVQSGCAKTIVQECGLERAIDLMHSYLKMTDRWFVDNVHDLKAMKGGLPKVISFHETGRMMTKRRADEIDRVSTNRQVFQEYLEEDRERRRSCEGTI